MALRGLAAAAVFVVCAVSSAAAQAPRKQYVSISYDVFRTQPLHFGEWPVNELVGREVSETQRANYEYETDDGLTRVDVIEFRRQGSGFGVTVYPFGLSSGSTLGVRVSREDLPIIQLAMAGPSLVPSYSLTDAYAVDGSIGIYMGDRAPGWGLGSHAFVAGGLGWVRSTLSDGQRYFAEGGGGLSVGPIAVQLAVKIAINRLDTPVEHQFFTVPIALRTSVSF